MHCCKHPHASAHAAGETQSLQPSPGSVVPCAKVDSSSGLLSDPHFGVQFLDSSLGVAELKPYRALRVSDP